MIDFTAVSREIRSVLARRRELLTFLGSVFAALGIFLQNLLGGSLPPSLQGLQEHTSAAYALLRIESDPCGPFERDRWEEHVADSLRDANHDMITILALVGLIVFSAFEGLTGLGRAAGKTDLSLDDVKNFGPLAYGLLM